MGIFKKDSPYKNYINGQRRLARQLEYPWERRERLEKRNKRIRNLIVGGVTTAALGVGSIVGIREWARSKAQANEPASPPPKSLNIDKNELSAPIHAVKPPLPDDISTLPQTELTPAPTPAALEISAEAEPETPITEYAKEIGNNLKYGGGWISYVGGISVEFDSRQPEQFGKYFDTVASSHMYTGMREYYGLGEVKDEHALDGQALYNNVMLESLEYSAVRQNPNLDPNYSAEESTLELLHQFYNNLVGFSEDRREKLDNLWRNELLSRINAGASGSQFLVDYKYYFADVGAVEITTSDNQIVKVISWDDFISRFNEFTVQEQLEFLNGFKSQLETSDPFLLSELEADEGSKLLALLNTVDYFGLNSILEDYAPVTTEETDENRPEATPTIPISSSGPETEYAPNNKNYTTWEVWHGETPPPYYNEMMHQLTRPPLSLPYRPVVGDYVAGYDLAHDVEYERNNAHTGVDFLAIDKDNPPKVIAPMDMVIIQADGPNGNYGIVNGHEIGQGDHVVIGYLGEFTYTDEQGNEMVGDVYANFGHLEPSDEFRQLIENARGPTQPHEVVSLRVPAGTELGVTGDSGLGVTGYDQEGKPIYGRVNHLHFELVVSWRSKNGVSTGNPNPHLSLETHGLPPGLRYTQGNDGKWYVQTGDIFEILAPEGTENISRSAKHQWPWGKNITFIKFYEYLDYETGNIDNDTLVSFLNNSGSTAVDAKGNALNKPVSQRFLNSVIGTHNTEDGKTKYTLLLKNTQKNLTLTGLHTDQPRLIINGQAFDISENKAAVIIAINKIRRDKRTPVFLTFAENGDPAQLSYLTQHGVERSVSLT